jgi:hypothetical protein
MHPALSHMIAQSQQAEREAEARKARLTAQARRSGAQRRMTPGNLRGGLRSSLGYRLVDIGLRLALHETRHPARCVR